MVKNEQKRNRNPVTSQTIAACGSTGKVTGSDSGKTYEGGVLILWLGML